jgi:hypothetical protein
VRPLFIKGFNDITLPDAFLFGVARIIHIVVGVPSGPTSYRSGFPLTTAYHHVERTSSGDDWTGRGRVIFLALSPDNLYFMAFTPLDPVGDQGVFHVSSGKFLASLQYRTPTYHGVGVEMGFF